MIKEYAKNYSVNPLYIIFRNANGYFKEINKSKYLTVSKTLVKKKEEKLWGKIRDLIG